MKKLLCVSLVLLGFSTAYSDVVNWEYQVVTSSSPVHFPLGANPYLQVDAKRETSQGIEESIRYHFGPGTMANMWFNAVSQGDGDPATPNAPDSFFDIFLESFSGRAAPGDVPYRGFMIDSFFDVFCSTGQGGKVGEVVVNYFAPDSFFDVFLEMNVPTAGGEQTIHIRGTLNPDQPVAFSGLQTTTGIYQIDSFFDIFTEICSTAGDEASGYFEGYKLNTPLMTMQIEIIPEPVTMMFLALGGVAAISRRRRS